ILRDSWDSREIITLVFASDAARRRPYLFNTHRSSLIAQDPKTCSFVLLSKIKICGHLLNLCHQRAIKILYKTEFSYKSSWKVESAQLENFYFPVGKLFFLSWKVKISQ
ncbi:MAG: hypothetical protein IKU85_09020, partial [Bacteroidaceae bacterium]|nr:hypothetical protein [Bacteroidaceae bacterium]